MDLMEYKVENLQCFLCFITFSDPKSKARHMKKTHGDIYKQQLQQTETKFSCYKCDKFYYTSEELSEHSTTHDNDEKSFQCPYCRDTFYTFTEVTKHRRWDCGKRQCPCKDCGIKFPNPSRLNQHRLKVHSSRVGAPREEDLTYKCCKCNCIFQNEDELIDHQERDLDCTISEPKPPPKKRGRKPKNSASQEDSLQLKDQSVQDKRQVNVHSVKQESSELRIPCPEADCDALFPSVHDLRVHKKEVHARVSQKLHGSEDKDLSGTEVTCPSCGEAFTNTSLLLSHMTSHCKKEEPDGEHV